MTTEDRDWLNLWDEFVFMFQEDCDNGLGSQERFFWNMDEYFNMLAIAEGRL